MSRNLNKGGFTKEDPDLVAKTVKFDLTKKSAEIPEDMGSEEKLPLKEGSPQEHKLPKELFDQEAKRDNAQIAQDFLEASKDDEEPQQHHGTGFVGLKELAHKGMEAVKEGIHEGIHTAQMGLEAVKESMHNAAEYIKEHVPMEHGDKEQLGGAGLHTETERKIAAAQKEIRKGMSIEKVDLPSHGVPEIGRAIKRAGSLKPEKTPEQLALERHVAQKRLAEQHELEEVVHEAAEGIKSHTLPSTTKSKADQIREQAAMIEAARGKTRISKGKGVNHQFVQHALADLEYIEKLQEEGEKAVLPEEEENIRNLIASHEKKLQKNEKQSTLSRRKEILKALAKEAAVVVRTTHPSKSFNPELNESFPHVGRALKRGLSSDQKNILSMLAHEAAEAVTDNDPSAAYPAEDDECFPPDEYQHGYDVDDIMDDYGRSLLSTIKEKAQKAANWLKKTVGSQVEERPEQSGEGNQMWFDEPSERPLGLAERFKEKLHDAAEWVASKVTEQSSGNEEKEGSLKDSMRHEKHAH